MTTLTYDHEYSFFDRTWNTGASCESKKIESIVARCITEFRQRGDRARAHLELQGVATQLVAAGNAVNIQIAEHSPLLQLARRFVNALPSTLPAPSVDLDPDGEVSFDWVFSRDKMLTVSLNSEGRLSFAAIFGPNKKQHGTELFDDGIPDAILRCIKRVEA